MFRLAIVVAALAATSSGQDDSTFENRIAHAEETIKQYEKRLNEQEKIIGQQQIAIESLMRTAPDAYADEPIAFTAVADDQAGYVEGDTIRFPTVITNYGVDYNPATFTFICPFEGIYIFSATLYVQRDNWISADIVKNGVPLIQVMAPDTIQDDQSSHKVMAVCLPGEQVWVRCVDDGVVEGRINNNAAVTTFSGILVTRT